jgi:transcriptional regulator with XRE-family HTH domain
LTTLSDVAEMLKNARREVRLSQDQLAKRAGVSRTTVARMENLAKGDMSVSALVRLLEAAGYDLKLVKPGHTRTVEDILAEQRRGDSA